MGFFSNNCRFDGCGLKCSSLLELVEHIEQFHVPPLDFDPTFGISPSSVLRLCAFPFSNGAISQTSTSSLISSASDYEDAASDSGQGSIDSSSLYNKSDSSNLTSPISLNGLKLIDVDKNNNSTGVIKQNEFYVCGVQNCQKSYKSISNLTQHRQSSHNIITELSDRHSCIKCRRSYKTPKGLKSHQRNSPQCNIEANGTPIVRILKPTDQNSGIKKVKTTIQKNLQFTKKILGDPSKISTLQQHLLNPVISKAT